MIEVFIKLILSHAWCDYTLQSDSMAKGKCHRSGGQIWPYWLGAHAATHATGVWYFTGSVWMGLAEFVLHWLIDFLKCENVTNIHQDQLLHVICKVVYVLILFYG